MNAPDPITPETPMRRAAKLGWGVLIVATLYVCYFSHLGAIGFVGPDEPRYAWIARDMAESGDWVTPRLYGQPWFEKPVLYYWGGALSFKLFGVSEAAARLPSAVSALLATLALAWLAWRLYGAETARWLLLLLPTSVGMLGFSHAAATDMPFSGMLTIAMAAAAVVLGLPRHSSDTSPQPTPWLALGAFGFFLGAAVLAKGPAAVILSGGAVFFWAVFTRRWRDAFRLFHPAALASFFATALPWYILCARRNPDFFRVFIIEHNFKRYLTPEFRHIQPFWFYIPILVLAIFPWSLLLVPLLSKAVKGFRTGCWPGSRGILLLCWSLFPIAFFSLSKSKLPGYILPAVPPMVLLASRSARELLHSTSRRSRWGLEWVALTPVFLAIALLFGRFYTHVNSMPQPPRGYKIALLLLIIGETMALTVLIGARSRKGALISSVLAVVLLVHAIERYELPWMDACQSPRTAARLVLALGPAPHSVFTAQMDRNWQYALNFYFHRELPEWTPGSPPLSYVFVSSAGLEALDEQGIRYEFLGAVTTRRNLVKTAAAGGVSGLATPEWKK
ncbi:MAG: glycosyltransferase family 39 protein [Acidobacteriia bacterium]|nr:glycosyltransferase family 39 protein [Terriglobia bacterium]